MHLVKDILLVGAEKIQNFKMDRDIIDVFNPVITSSILLNVQWYSAAEKTEETKSIVTASNNTSSLIHLGRHERMVRRKKQLGLRGSLLIPL